MDRIGKKEPSCSHIGYTKYTEKNCETQNAQPCLICSHVTGTSGWLPPQSSWDGGGTGLPFGWEAAHDKEGRVYYVK